MDLLLGVPVILGIVQVVKTTGYLSRKFVPLFALWVGMIVFSVFGDSTWQMNILEGIIASLTAMGLWSGTKSTIAE